MYSFTRPPYRPTERRGFLFLCSVIVAGCGGGGGGEDTRRDPTDTEPPVHTLSGSPPTQGVEDERIDFQVGVNNPGGNTLSFDIANAPQWLSISSTGRLSGTATTDQQTGTFENLIISAQDPAGNQASLPPFTLTVTPINDAPEVEAQTTLISLDSATNDRVTFSATDEESDVIAVSIEADVHPASVQTIGGEIVISAPEISEFTRGRITISADDGVNQTDLIIPVRIYPVNSQGNGRTISGRTDTAGVELIVLGDGYTSSMQQSFLDDAHSLVDFMGKDEGISEHLVIFNVHAVFTPSAEAGSDEQFGEDTVDTFFDSGYGCSDIRRLICIDSSRAIASAFDAYPDADHIVMIINDARPGGSGGSVAVFNRTLPEFGLHELGHSFAGLADEYIDEDLAANARFRYKQGDYANISNSPLPEEAPWRLWIEDGSAGLYEGALYNAEGFYRPLQDSLMRTYDQPMGVVNSEQWIVASYRAASHFSVLEPEQSRLEALSGQPVTVRAVRAFGEETQSLTWFLNGREIADAKDQETVTIESLLTGKNTIRVEAQDVSGKVRRDDDLGKNFHEWEVTIQ